MTGFVLCKIESPEYNLGVSFSEISLSRIERLFRYMMSGVGQNITLMVTDKDCMIIVDN
jgi:hypothetical protein